MADDETVWFSSKVDWWIGIALATPLVSATVVLVLALPQGRPFLAFAPAVMVALIYALVLFPTRYGISTSELIVRFGLVTGRVPLARILTVTPSHRLFGAPALSLERLEIRWGRGRFEATIVSPGDRSRFLTFLEQQGGLSRAGDRLERRAADDGCASE